MTISTADFWAELLASTTKEEFLMLKRWLRSHPQTVQRFLDACAQLPYADPDGEIEALIAEAMAPDKTIN
jgi:GrpB-like predicted nucleotidyltransferase (UPF0157 family)